MIKKTLNFCLDFLIVISSILCLCLLIVPIAVVLIILIGLLLILFVPVIIIAMIWWIGIAINKLYNYIKKFFKKIKYPIDK